jgi:hypothetical protein
MTNTSPSSQGRSASIRKAICITFVVSFVSFALGTLLIACFDQIRQYVDLLIVAIGIFAIGFNLFLSWNYPNDKKRRVILVITADYVFYFVYIFLYHLGAPFGFPFVTLMLCVLFILNLRNADGIPILCLSNANTIFAVIMSVVFNGLMYAHNISRDLETFAVISLLKYFVTFLSLGFSIIALLIKKRIGK